MTSFAFLDKEHKYMVDSDGNVYGPKFGLLKGWSACDGRYRQITMHHQSKHYVHRLVAAAFIPNPENKPDVAHWDGDGTNNAAHNLRWATEVENMADKKRHGTHIKGERHGNAKLTDAQVRDIRKMRDEGEHIDHIAWCFGVSKWTVYDACNPKRRKLADY